MRKCLVLLLIAVMLSGCGLAIRALEFASPTFEELREERHNNDGQVMVDKFQRLLSDGWRLFLYDGNKIVLVKDSPDGLLIEDVFGVLDE